MDQSCFYFVKSFAIPSCTNTYYINKVAIPSKFLWYKRLGHALSMVLQHLHFLQNSSMEPFVSYDICHLSKRHELAFPTSQSHAGHIFYLIHLDIWGPYKQPSISRAHYALTIVNDYSHATWTFLLHHKHQTIHTLNFFFKMVQTQFHI